MRPMQRGGPRFSILSNVKGTPMESPVLQMIASDKLPPPEIACRNCQYATWMEFKRGARCYCAVTMAWMYEPDLQAHQLVIACDKQMAVEQSEAGPEAH